MDDVEILADQFAGKIGIYVIGIEQRYSILQLVALCGQRAEQLLAGAPCGVMDQMTATYGAAGELLAILCRPADVAGSQALPSGLAVWGIDSGARHTVSGSPYRRARCASFIGKALLGLDVEYLAEVDRSELDVERLPELLAGAEFRGAIHSLWCSQS